MVELAEDELKNFGKVWAIVIISQSYCFFIGKVTPKVLVRLIAVLPVICLFLVLPLNLTSLHLCGFTAFSIAWLANFKLLLFAFGEPPLCPNNESDLHHHHHPPISFPCFLAISCLPIKLQSSPAMNSSYPNAKNSEKQESNKYPDHKTPKKSNPDAQKSPWNYIIKGVILALILRIYDYTPQIPQKLVWIIYFIHSYLAIELTFAFIAKTSTTFLGLELEPQFNEPLLSTSLQDFWGRRWNLMVTSILRPTVFRPARDLLARILGPNLARLSAVMGTFVVSAIMHELIFFYLGRVRPTFEVTWFFLLHGFCLCVEMVVKRYLGEKLRVPRWVSGPLTGFLVVATGFWLFLPSLLRAGLATKGVQEYAVAGAFFRRVVENLKSKNGTSTLVEVKGVF